jgi:uncharacterized protein YndB with AHSA1/START domain
MSLTKTAGPADERLVFECDLDAPPEKVWRAVTVPGLRERWLPGATLADLEPVTVVPGEEVRYRMREDTPPFESTVSFEIEANDDGGTRLRIVHRLVAGRDRPNVPAPANSNGHSLMLAA